MKKVILSIIMLVALAIGLKAAQDTIIAPSGKKITANQILGAGSSGNEFIIAIPSNETFFLVQDYIHIYVTSQFNISVNFVENSLGSGKGKTIPIKAYRITTISRTYNDEINVVAEFEKPINKTFTLTSKNRFSVYVMNKKTPTSDGYLAIPTSSWGKKYMHLSYYDNPDTGPQSQGFARGGGFVILAKSNNTHVKIRVVDQTNKNIPPFYGLGRTIGGKRGNDSIDVVLQANQAYAMQGNGLGPTTGGVIGYLDLSGTEIESDSSIGVISYHNRTDIPNNFYDYGNYLVEMVPPITAWGKKIATVEFDRNNRGDLIRILASEDNTNISIRWFNKKTKTVINQTNQLLQKGDIWSYLDLTLQNATNTLCGVRGTCVIEADKPILAHQYAYSLGWDNDVRFDPFMITLTPTDQFVYSTVFQTPINFEQNFFNYIVKGYLPEDTLDEKFIDPKSGLPYKPNKINDMKLSSLYFGASDGSLNQITSIKGSRIPTTGGFCTSTGDTIGGLYWGTISTNSGVYIMESENNLTSFGGYIYGFATADGYGWPAAITFSKMGMVDKENPKLALKKQLDCYSWLFKYTDSTNYQINDSLTQEDLGIAAVYLNSDLNLIDSLPWSYNFTIVDTTADTLTALSVDSAVCQFTIRVLDKSKSARALVKVLDVKGNFRYDTVYYKPEMQNFTVDSIDFGDLSIANIPITKDVQLNNNGSDTISILATKLASQISKPQRQSAFALSDGISSSQIIMPNQYYTLKVAFSTSIIKDNYYSDTLLCITKCDTLRMPIRGRVIAPRINVEPDINWGHVALASLSSPACDSTVIYNRGTDTLSISGYKGISDTAVYDLSKVPDPPASLLPFSIYCADGSQIMFPIKIAPNDSFVVRTCFYTTLAGIYSKYLVFISNAYKGDAYTNDEIVQLSANTELVNISVDSLNFGDRRLLSRNKGTLTIKNSGESPIKLVYIKSSKDKKYRNINVNDGTLAIDSVFKIITDLRTVLVDSEIVNSKYFASSKYADVNHNITLDIEYLPKSETASCDTLHFYFVKVALDSLGRIDVKKNLFSSPYYTLISGNTYLPKASISEPQVFAKPVRKDSVASDTLSVLLSDTSSSRSLSVQSIELIYDDNQYKSIDLINQPNVPTIIEKDKPLIEKVVFKGKDNGDYKLFDCNRSLTINAVTDSKDGSLLPWYCVTNNVSGAGEWRKDSIGLDMTSPLNSDTMTTISTKIKGTVYDYTRIINIDDSVAFDRVNVNSCDTANGKFTVYNASLWYGDTTGAGSTDIVVSDIKQYQDKANFKIVNYSDLPDTLSHDKSKTYNVKFTPELNVVRGYSSPIKVINDALTGKDSLKCTNSATTMSLNFALDMDISDKAISTLLKSQKPGNTIPIGLIVKDDSKIDLGSNLKHIALNLVYDMRDMKYANKVETGEIADAWSWTGAESIKTGSDTLAILRLEGSGESEISKTGSLAVPYFDLLLHGGNREVHVNIDSSSVDYFKQDFCAEVTSEGGSIELNTCVIDLRGVLIGGKYALSAGKQNPITGSYFTATYSVSYEEPVLIELYNSLGELVKTVVSEQKKQGDYSSQISTNGLNSGVYFLRMHAGVFSDVKEVVIIK